MKEGFSMVEIIVAGALLTAFVAAILAASHFELKAVDESARLGKAAYILEEGLEAVRIMRDRSWTSNIAVFSSGTTYYPLFSINWKLQTTDPGAIDGVFTRTIILEEVYRRNSDDDIVDISSLDPKTVDPNTRKVTATVTWKAADGTSRSESISTYVANIFQN